MLNSSSSILPLLNALDKLVSNTAVANVAMSINFVTFVSFFWHILVSTEIIRPAIAPVKDATPNGMLTGRPTNVLNIATHDIPVAMLNPLEQAFSHVSCSNILAYFCISPYTFPLIFLTLATYFELRSDGRRPEVPQEPMGQSDINCSLSSFKEKMADVDINPFGEHESKPEEPMGENIPLTPVGGGSTWEPEREQQTSFGVISQRTRLMKDYVKDLYKRLSENIGEPQKNFILIISNSKMGNCTTEARTSP